VKIAENLYRILYELYGFSIGDRKKIKEVIFAQAGLALLLSSIYYCSQSEFTKVGKELSIACPSESGRRYS